MWEIWTDHEDHESKPAMYSPCKVLLLGGSGLWFCSSLWRAEQWLWVAYLDLSPQPIPALGADGFGSAFAFLFNQNRHEENSDNKCDNKAKKTREKTNNDTSLHQPLNHSGSISMRLWHQGQNRTKHLAESSKWTWHYLSTSEQCHFEGLGLRWRRWLRSRRWWLLRHQSGLFTESSDIRSERHQWYKWHISYDTSDTYSNTM